MVSAVKLASIPHVYICTT